MDDLQLLHIMYDRLASPAPVEATELHPVPVQAPSQSSYYDDVHRENYNVTKCPAYVNQIQKSVEYSYVTVTDGNKDEKPGYVNVPAESKDQNKDEKPGYVNVPAESKESDYAVMTHNM